jgi:hypothetical protein
VVKAKKSPKRNTDFWVSVCNNRIEWVGGKINNNVESFLSIVTIGIGSTFTIQMLFPLMLSMICNIYYRRKLFDFSPLPEIKK